LARDILVQNRRSAEDRRLNANVMGGAPIAFPNVVPKHPEKERESDRDAPPKLGISRPKQDVHGLEAKSQRANESKQVT
jgi:hypothetical protein